MLGVTPADALATLSDRLAYLQRPPLVPLEHPATVTYARPENRAVVTVQGVGRADKSASRTGTDRRSAATDRPADVLGGLIIGLHDRSPLALQVSSRAGRLCVQLGVWSSRTGLDAAVDARAGALRSLLRGSFADVDLAEGDLAEGNLAEGAVPPGLWPVGGYVLGVPSVGPPRAGDERGPWDRVVDSMGATSWSALVLAQPVSESTVARFRDDLLIEWRHVQQETKVSGDGSPLADHYDQLLKTAVSAATEAITVGAWRIAVYLQGDAASYLQLAATWRAVFGSVARERDAPQVIESGAVPELAHWWGLSDTEAPRGPGRYRRAFAHQSLLTSRELACYVDLPQQEHQGFTVFQTSTFDTAPNERTEHDAVQLGHVVVGRRRSEAAYRITASSLNRHAFVTGVTGAGKTNTVLTLVKAVAATGAAFLVLEPAKAEYRTLISSSALADQLTVFTVGDETVAPLRLNPFEVPPGTPIGVHIDLLRSLFTAAFGLWTPLPQILEQALHLTFTDLGWDVATGRNRRLRDGEDPRLAAPTMTQLAHRIDGLIDSLHFDPEAAGRIRGSLSARLNSLRVGAKGRMLDVSHGTPAHKLFDTPAVLELERLGDDQDKAFVMGLVLIRLAEHRRAQGPVRDGLRHLLVVEEAHRLLGRPQAKSGDEANASGNAVEAFTNLLAEVRAYGQGIVVADQVPARLAPEVLKNTNLKVVHRLVADDDRRSVGATMGMSERQRDALVSLPPFRAAVFAEGDDAPLLIDFDNARTSLVQTGDDALRMTEAVDNAPWAGDIAREIVGTAAFRRLLSRLVASTITAPAAAGRLWPGLALDVARRLPAGLDSAETAQLWSAVAEQGAAWLADRRGAQAGWGYAATAAFCDGIAALVRSLASDNAAADGTQDAAAHLAKIGGEYLVRAGDPFPECHRICPAADRPCRYRWGNVDTLEPGAYTPLFTGALDEDETAESRTYAATFGVGQQAASETVEWPGPTTPDAEYDDLVDAALAASLCAAQLGVAAQGGFEITNRIHALTDRHADFD